MSNNISLNFAHVMNKVREAEEKYSRSPHSVSVLAVSKGQPIALIKALAEEGQTAFGENYLQEALPKISALRDLGLVWHYIGRIQSKKASLIATHFDWVHTLSRLKEAEALSHFRPTTHPPLNVCIQIKLDNNPGKLGIAPDELLAFVEHLTVLPHLRLRGLMTLPPPLDSFSEQRHFFSKLKDLFKLLREKGVSIDTLSMGMTHDFEAAIAEGATCVRIGRGFFS